MRYTREEIRKIVRGYTSKHFIYKNKKYMRLRRLSFMGVPSVHHDSVLWSNGRFYKRMVYWKRKLKNRKFNRKLYKTFVKSKKRNVLFKLRNYKHYILTFKSFFSNFYIMLTDNEGNPLISCSTGQVSKSRSKKRKNSLMLVYPMMRRIKFILIKRRIKNLAIHIRTDISAKVIASLRFLKYSRLKYNISYIALLKPTPHHFGRRQRKPRRV